MKLAAAALTTTLAFAGCDDPEKASGAAATNQPAAPAAPEVDWSQVETVSEEDAKDFLWGLVRILDAELEPAAGTVVLQWAPRGAVVAADGSIEITWFWPPASPRHRDVSPALWKTAVEHVTEQRHGFVTKPMPATAFSDDRGPARNTGWTITRGEGAAPTLNVEWWTR